MKSENLLFKSQNSIISAAVVIAITTGINAFLGLIKGRFLTYYFGVSEDLAIFYTADRIPNMVYSLLVVGALSTVFIPVFSNLLKKDADEAWETATTTINISMVFFLILGLGAYIFSPEIIRFISIGQFAEDSVIVGASLMRLMLIGQLVLVLSSFISTLLQTFKLFLIPALAPVLYNIGMIVSTIVGHEQYGIYAPAIGVIVGAILHLLIQIPAIIAIKPKYRFTLKWNGGIIQLLKLIPYRILSVFVANSIQTINNSFAILVSSSAVIYLKFATQLQTLPINLFGASISIAALPTLSSETDQKNLEKFKKTFLTSLLQMLYLVIPASLILIVLKVPVVRLVYGVTGFPWEATVKTSYALAFFGLSITFQSTMYLLTRSFYALKDTKTPVIISLLTIPLNVSLTYLCVSVLGLGVWSIAMIFSLTSLADCFLLAYRLHKKVGGFNVNDFLKPFIKISYASLIMGAALYIPLKFLDQFVFDTTRTINLLLLTIVTGIAGLGTYLLLTKWMKVSEIQMFYKLLKKLNFATANQPQIVETKPTQEN